MNKQITAADRKVVETLLSENYKPSFIAKTLRKHKSTICREINRCPVGHYNADLADLSYRANRSRCKAQRKVFTYKQADFVIAQIKIGWSPEQIVGWLRKKGFKTPCVETIYRFVYEYPPNKEEKLYQYLRRGKKKRTKQHGRKTHTEKIANKVSIHQRPINVLSRKEFGHFEGDSVIYPHKKAINTLNELKTGYVRFTLLNRKTATETKEAQIKVLQQYHKVKTLTLERPSWFPPGLIGILIYSPIHYCKS